MLLLGHQQPHGKFRVCLGKPPLCWEMASGCQDCKTWPVFREWLQRITASLGRLQTEVPELKDPGSLEIPTCDVYCCVAVSRMAN